MEKVLIIIKNESWEVKDYSLALCRELLKEQEKRRRSGTKNQLQYIPFII